MARSKGPHGRGPRVHRGARPAGRSSWFKPGPDARRHQLTAEERRRGGITRGRQFIAEMDEAVYHRNDQDEAHERAKLLLGLGMVNSARLAEKQAHTEANRTSASHADTARRKGVRRATSLAS